jgi:hypothetical protein
MPITSLVKVPFNSEYKDTIRIKGSKMSLNFNVFSGKQGDYWVFYVPGINVSGYGKTKEEAEDFLNIEMEVFCEDVMGMSKREKEAFISSLGFAKELFRSKNFSKAYVDADGKLQEFDEGTLEHNVLETAV